MKRLDALISEKLSEESSSFVATASLYVDSIVESVAIGMVNMFSQEVRRQGERICRAEQRGIG